MSNAVLEERVGTVEREQARQGAELGQVRATVSKIENGVERLLEREATRPEALTFKAIAGTASGIIAAGAVVWWLIEASPAVRSLNERVTRLDDKEIGRVTLIERAIGDWKTTIVRK